MKKLTGTRRITLCGLLTAIMLILGFLESRLPAGPIPGIKLGLSNSVLVFSIYLLGIPTSYLLMLAKVLLSAVLFGKPGSAALYALSGGLLSVTAMALLSRVKGLRVPVVSMAGGLMHNVGQTLTAMAVLQTPKLLFYMAILMCAGTACGALTGVCAAAVMRILRKRVTV